MSVDGAGLGGIATRVCVCSFDWWAIGKVLLVCGVSVDQERENHRAGMF